MSLIIALLIFSGIILFHEWGHFLLARRAGVEVVEFSLGMGPRLISVERGGTRYSWKLLPLGGSCQMKGEDMADMSEGAFASKDVWSRLSIILAGPVFNFILAYILAVILILCAGIDRPTLLHVEENYPAASAGLQAGDDLISINGKRIQLAREISDYVEFHQKELSGGSPIEVTYVREGETYHTQLTPQDNGSGRYVMGISVLSAYRTPVSFTGALKYGGCEVKYWIELVFQSLKMMFTGKVTMEDVSGPVGVVQAIDTTYEESKSDGAYYIFLNMLNIAILLSANLGVMNLLPIPALDGGRTLFLLIEVIRRRRMDPDLEGKIHLVGFALLMALMVVVLLSDVRKLL